MQHADDIVVLDENGRISAQGEFDTVKETDSYVQQLYENQSSQIIPPKDLATLDSDSGTELAPISPPEADKEEEAPDTDVLSTSPKEEEVLPRGSVLGYYLSAMGSSTLFVFAALVFFNIGCNIAQRT